MQFSPMGQHPGFPPQTPQFVPSWQHPSTKSEWRGEILIENGLGRYRLTVGARMVSKIAGPGLTDRERPSGANLGMLQETCNFPAVSSSHGVRKRWQSLREQETEHQCHRGHAEHLCEGGGAENPEALIACFLNERPILMVGSQNSA